MAPDAAEAIVAVDLVKRYEGGAEAVRGVSFRVGAGEIVGLLGPNGAGKSTTLNMIATLVTPSGGEARVFGHPVTDRRALKPLLGVALQATGVDPMMSVNRHFEVQAALYRMDAGRARERAAHLIEAFDLGAVGGRVAGELSGGTQRRLSLALALLHEPRAIVFDEPTAGLDPNAKRTVWALLRELREQGLTILFSTHDMHEAEHLCDRIEMIADGRIVASGTPAELKAEVTRGVLLLRLRDGAERARGVLRRAAGRGLLPEQPDLHGSGDVLRIEADLLDPAFLPLLALLADEASGDILEISWGHGSLDDVFVRLGNGGPAPEAPSSMTVDRLHSSRGRSR